MKQLDERQMEAANLYIARKHNGMTVQQIADQVGVSRRGLFNWTQLPEFKAYVQEQTVEVAREHLDDVLANLIKLATKTGNVKAIDTYLRVVGVLGNDNVKVEVNTVNNTEDRSDAAIKSRMTEIRKMLGYDVEEEIPVVQPSKNELQRQKIELLKLHLNQHDVYRKKIQ